MVFIGDAISHPSVTEEEDDLWSSLPDTVLATQHETMRYLQSRWAATSERLAQLDRDLNKTEQVSLYCCVLVYLFSLLHIFVFGLLSSCNVLSICNVCLMISFIYYYLL